MGLRRAGVAPCQDHLLQSAPWSSLEDPPSGVAPALPASTIRCEPCSVTFGNYLVLDGAGAAGTGRQQVVSGAAQHAMQPSCSILHAAHRQAVWSCHGGIYPPAGCRAAVSRRGPDEWCDEFCEVHVNTMEGCWSLLPSWLRPDGRISQEGLPLSRCVFQAAYSVHRHGNAIFPGMLIENKYAVIAAVAVFLLVLRLTGGSMFAALGALGLIAGVGWAARKLLQHR